VPLTAFDPEAVLAALEQEGVRYVVIGGLAAVLHGSPLLTQGIDICPAADAENLKRLAKALRNIGAGSGPTTSPKVCRSRAIQGSQRETTPSALLGSGHPRRRIQGIVGCSRFYTAERAHWLHIDDVASPFLDHAPAGRSKGIS
jgi:hypothetical protein